MKKTTISILFIALLLLSGQRASGQETPASITMKKGSTQQAFQPLDTGMSHCDSLFNEAYYAQEDGRLQASYDTLRLFIELCPFYDNSGDSYTSAFEDLISAVQQGAGGANRYSDFLTWLKQVLYLNPSITYYCQDVADMITAALEYNLPAQEAVAQYVVASGKCPGDGWLYGSASIYRHKLWLDSIVYKYDTVVPMGIVDWWRDSLINKDTLAHPYDTTFPSLYALDLQILMGPQYAGVQASQPITSQALMNAQLLENPMKNVIDIAFDMGRTALVTMQLSDVLGRTVPLTYAKYQLEQPGQHDATIPAPNLPPGTYYLRISTDVGDAITLKVVKER
jgi:hypothetical protein